MTMPRYAQLSLVETPWYHVVSRCVRRAYLCGVDHITGQSYTSHGQDVSFVEHLKFQCQ